jgi:multisite-specific tRNA:(cytosine-C5)-methyltransferase
VDVADLPSPEEPATEPATEPVEAEEEKMETA